MIREPHGLCRSFLQRVNRWRGIPVALDRRWRAVEPAKQSPLFPEPAEHPLSDSLEDVLLNTDGNEERLMIEPTTCEVVSRRVPEHQIGGNVQAPANLRENLSLELGVSRGRLLGVNLTPGVTLGKNDPGPAWNFDLVVCRRVFVSVFVGRVAVRLDHRLEM